MGWQKGRHPSRRLPTLRDGSQEAVKKQGGGLPSGSDAGQLQLIVRDTGPGIPQVLGGQISSMSSPLGDWLQHVASGKARILATSGPTRSPFTPNVPNYKEQGFDELTVREARRIVGPNRVVGVSTHTIEQARPTSDIVNFADAIFIRLITTASGAAS